MSFIDSNGSKVDVEFEGDEQKLVSLHLPRNSCVLELGARYGTVSCMISSVLDEPTKHVAVEPDTSVISALNKNRDSNNGQFHIWNGVVSKKPQKLMTAPPPSIPGHEKYIEYSCFTEECKFSNLQNLDLEALQNKYNLKFDALVADCEGFFPKFVEENIDNLTQFKTIIYEKDGSPWVIFKEKYKKVESILTEKGYRMIDSRPARLPEHKDNTTLHSVWKLQN